MVKLVLVALRELDEDIVDDFNEHEFGGVHGNNIKHIFGNANNNVC
jgi:hypothetical protein